MKKTLAIVLALVMVLAMVPAAFAAPTTIVTQDKDYTISIAKVNKGATALSELKQVVATKKISFEYDLATLEKTNADKWAEDKYMAKVAVKGFALAPNGANTTVTINGKTLALGAKNFDGAVYATEVHFPIELPKTGINMTYEIIVEKDDGTTLTREIAKVTLSGANTATYKDEKAASFTLSSDKGNAYMVGNTVYVDYQFKLANRADADNLDTLTFTFFNDAGARFSEVTYLNEIADFGHLNGYVNADGSKLSDKSEFKIEDVMLVDGEGTFKLESRNNTYKTAKVKFVCRYEVTKVDPKGIYFAESSKTIKIGESYTPVVMGVVTNLPVKADVFVTGSGAELSLINIIDKKTVYGLAAGTTYITAKYEGTGIPTYEASSMKITVLNEAFQGPATGTEKYVTCRTLNVRAGAGTSYKIVGKLSRNTKVAVLETANGWSKISFNGGTAYVSDKYLAK